MISSRLSPLPLAGLLVAITGVVLAADAALPLGVAAGTLSIAVVLVASLFQWSYAPVLGAALASASIIGGYFASPVAGVPDTVAILNRLLSLVVVWAVAILLLKFRRMYPHRQGEAGWQELAAHFQGELDHRVKNMLAKVSSLVAGTLRTAETTRVAAVRADARIDALSAAYDVVAAHRWGAVPLRVLLTRVLGPGAGRQIELHGEDLEIPSQVAFTLATGICELAMNAQQHGALSSPDGRVSLRWRKRGKVLVLYWRERGGPLVRPPETAGFGLKSIKWLFVYEADGVSRVKFDPGGLRCLMAIPH